MASRLSQAWAWARGSGSNFGLQVLINAVLPWVIYNLGKKQLGDVYALMLSSGPPILWSLVEFARHRKVDAISILALLGIALGFIGFIGTGGVKFLQLRETLAGGVVGLVFVGSVIIRRPIIYYLARDGMRRNNAAEAENLESLKGNVFFERTMTVMTLVWGLGLMTHTALNVVLVFALPSISTYLAISPVTGYGTMGALALWTFYYTRRARRLGEARRAAAAAAAVQAEAASAGAEPALAAEAST